MPDLGGTTDLDELMQSATVRITGRDGQFWGSGFLVAPGWVLTAAHVLRAGLVVPEKRGDPFTVVFMDEDGLEQRAEGRLAYWPRGVFDEPSLTEELDIALVELSDPGIEHTCAWLSDRTGEPTAELKAYGWHRKDGRLHAWDGRFNYSGKDGSYGLRLGPDSQVPPGVSGGPVIDLDTRAVVGFVKRNSISGTGDIREGGLAVRTALLRTLLDAETVAPARPLGGDPYAELMRRHDRWHREYLGVSGWQDEQLRAPAHVGAGAGRPPDPELWSPADRMTVLGMLSELPDPGSPERVTRLVRAALYGKKRLPGGLRTLRDGHGCLYRPEFSYPALPFLRYTRLVALAAKPAAPDAAGQLLTWLRFRMEGLTPDRVAEIEQLELPTEWDDVAEAPAGGPEEEMPPDPLLQAAPTFPGDGHGPTVLLELFPVPWTDRCFHASLHVQNGAEPMETWKMLEPPEGIPQNELADELRRPLLHLFRQVDTEHRKAPLEVVLHLRDFDQPVQLWMLHAVAGAFDNRHPAFLPLGVQRQVVVRASADFWAEHPEAWERAEHRWQALTGTDALHALRTPPYGRLLSEPYLDGAEAGAIPALCHPVGDEHGREAMTMALRQGHRVVLWNTAVHAVMGCDGRCGELHEQIAKMVRDTRSVRQLPENVRVLRARIHRSDPDAQWAGNLAVLYDDPTRPLSSVAGTVDSP